MRHENDIPAEEERSQGPWIPCQNGFRRRKESSESPSCQGPQIHCLRPLRRGLFSAREICKKKMESLTTLKKTDDFERIYREGRSGGNRLFVMYAAEPEPGREGRLGISVSKKVGNSVVRHRIRRLIKECFRLHISEWADRDYIVAARKEAVGKSFGEVEAALLHLGRKISVYTQPGENE